MNQTLRSITKLEDGVYEIRADFATFGGPVIFRVVPATDGAATPILFELPVELTDEHFSPGSFVLQVFDAVRSFHCACLAGTQDWGT